MSLSKKAVDEFKQLYKETYGEDLSDFIASEAANRLIQMFKIVYQPIPKAWENEYNEKKKEVEAIPEEKKVDFVKHLVSDAKVSEIRAQIGEKKFWEIVTKANKTESEGATG